jgi:hypothetical protein
MLDLTLDSKLQPHLKNVTELMLQANKDSDDEVALEACEFWYVPCKHGNPACISKLYCVHIYVSTTCSYS